MGLGSEMLHRLGFENSRIGSEAIEIDVPLDRAEMQVGKLLALAGSESDADIAAALEAIVNLRLHQVDDVLHAFFPSRIFDDSRGPVHNAHDPIQIAGIVHGIAIIRQCGLRA